MRGVPVIGSLVALVLIGLIALGQNGSTVVAQDATPGATTGHPLVGSWLLDTDADDPANPPSLARFSADGGYVQTDADGATAIGAWEASGEQTATVTFLFLNAEGDQFFGTGKVRATVEVDSSGDTFTATYTIEFTDPDGNSEGEFGPGSATATRLAVEPMGTTVGSLADLFASVPGGTPTP